MARRKSLEVLTTLQPENGGFLEATPLTAFVVMSLAACGQAHHPVLTKGVEFLVASMRSDGSWPIDTNLATWVTTLAIGALATCKFDESLPPDRRRHLTEWLLTCQHKRVHPYTHAGPGGWAWSDLPGAVPDGDDTAGALVALHHLDAEAAGLSEAVEAGIRWLLDLQNSDGGIPTFCKGWTQLPFDKSTPDITAHAVGAVALWLDRPPSSLRRHAEKGIHRALDFMRKSQRPDGAWVPLWFGNQHAANHENPVYGTSRALTHLSPYASRFALHEMLRRAAQWLLAAQNTDGGWGGDRGVVSSIEETALAVDALASVAQPDAAQLESAILRGAEWLIERTERGRSIPASPIGLYFARLWYFEELYPSVFALAALAKVRRLVM
jgi:squalene-hopene/tetraprenyl-beta-curcumene cyclase